MKKVYGIILSCALAAGLYAQQEEAIAEVPTQEMQTAAQEGGSYIPTKKQAMDRIKKGYERIKTCITQGCSRSEAFAAAKDIFATIALLYAGGKIIEKGIKKVHTSLPKDSSIRNVVATPLDITSAIAKAVQIPGEYLIEKPVGYVGSTVKGAYESYWKNESYWENPILYYNYDLQKTDVDKLKPRINTTLLGKNGGNYKIKITTIDPQSQLITYSFIDQNLNKRIPARQRWFNYGIEKEVRVP